MEVVQVKSSLDKFESCSRLSIGERKTHFTQPQIGFHKTFFVFTIILFSTPIQSLFILALKNIAIKLFKLNGNPVHFSERFILYAQWIMLEKQEKINSASVTSSLTTIDPIMREQYPNNNLSLQLKWCFSFVNEKSLTKKNNCLKLFNLNGNLFFKWSLKY